MVQFERIQKELSGFARLIRSMVAFGKLYNVVCYFCESGVDS